MSYDIPRLTKQPSESRVYTFDFTANMADGESIVSVDTFSVSPTGPTLGTPAASGKLVQARISGGTTDVEYKITIIVTTSDSNILEGEANLFVRNI